MSVEAVTVEVTFDLYVGLKEGKTIKWYREGEGPEDSRPNKFQKWAKVTLPVTLERE